jgi:hypothetical protein
MSRWSGNVHPGHGDLHACTAFVDKQHSMPALVRVVDSGI